MVRHRDTVRDPKPTYVKVLFDVEGYESVEIESMWAIVTDGGYRLDNIPFYAKGYALGDVISADRDEGGLLRCTGLVQASGHSTIRILCRDAERAPAVRDELSAMGCSSEADAPGLVAVDVPPDVPYDRIRSYLEQAIQTGGVDEYEEGCLGQ